MWILKNKKQANGHREQIGDDHRLVEEVRQLKFKRGEKKKHSFLQLLGHINRKSSVI